MEQRHYNGEVLASMGPRVFARGDIIAWRCEARGGWGFNGATRVRAWRYGCADALSARIG